MTKVPKNSSVDLNREENVVAAVGDGDKGKLAMRILHAGDALMSGQVFEKVLNKKLGSRVRLVKFLGSDETFLSATLEGEVDLWTVSGNHVAAVNQREWPKELLGDLLHE